MKILINFMILKYGQRKVFNIFSAIAILLACLGLFGLSAYSATTKNKRDRYQEKYWEHQQEISLFYYPTVLLKLVLVAFVIACPIAWFVMNKWLQDFAYRINISWWMFVLAGIVGIVHCIDNGKFPGN